MKKKTIIMASLLVILGGTLIDGYFIRSYNYFEYMIICTWEFLIFGVGVFSGVIFRRTKQFREEYNEKQYGPGQIANVS